MDKKDQVNEIIFSRGKDHSLNNQSHFSLHTMPGSGQENFILKIVCLQREAIVAHKLKRIPAHA